MNSHWALWCSESIYTRRNGIQTLRRNEAVSWLCDEGLLPLFKQAGYRLRLSSPQLSAALLRVMYALASGKYIRALPTHAEYPHLREHEIEYAQRLDTQTWMRFWETWGEMEFLPETPLYKFQALVPDLLWSWTDLGQSVAVDIVEDEIREQDYQDELSKGKEDPYLADTSRREYQDRHWH
jgi:hypothetical protein